MARVLGFLGVGCVRGSAARNRGAIRRKRGMPAFFELRSRLREGQDVGLTVETRQIPEEVGRGAVLLAKASGRPIVPVAIASKNSRELGTWDRAQVINPWQSTVVVCGEPIQIGTDADSVIVESRRCELETALQQANERAVVLLS